MQLVLAQNRLKCLAQVDEFDVDRDIKALYLSDTNLLDSPVKETHVIVRDFDPDTGNKMLNNYMILGELGRGVHGKVKLCEDTSTGEKWVHDFLFRPSKLWKRMQKRDFKASYLPRIDWPQKQEMGP